MPSLSLAKLHAHLRARATHSRARSSPAHAARPGSNAGAGAAASVRQASRLYRALFAEARKRAGVRGGSGVLARGGAWQASAASAREARRGR